MSSKKQDGPIPLKNLEGILLFANTCFPVENIKDQLEGRANSDELFNKTRDGFRMGQTITNLYMIEIMLKYLHQQNGEKNVRKGKPYHKQTYINNLSNSIDRLVRDDKLRIYDDHTYTISPAAREEILNKIKEND